MNSLFSFFQYFMNGLQVASMSTVTPTDKDVFEQGFRAHQTAVVLITYHNGWRQFTRLCQTHLHGPN